MENALADLEQFFPDYYCLEMKLGSLQNKVAPPAVTQVIRSGGATAVNVAQTNGVIFGLWRAMILDKLIWAPVTNAVVATNGAVVTLTNTQASEQTIVLSGKRSPEVDWGFRRAREIAKLGGARISVLV
jgi:hypothetical protein